MRVLVTGATGFIGSALCDRLGRGGHEVVALSRDAASARQRVAAISEAHDWDLMREEAPAAALQGTEAVVHMAGESVAGRWTATKQRAIRDTRVVGTRYLVQAMRRAHTPPALLICSSAIGYYGDRGDEELTEQSGPGDDFLARTCGEWEAEATAAEELGSRVLRLRTGIVLGRGGGALAEMLLPAKLGLGGPLGSGRQWWSWIHLDDVLGLIAHMLHPGTGASGALNNTAPSPVRQRDFARAMGRVLRRPAFMPAPALALRIVLGGFSTELLSSKRVLPAAAQAAGYSFRHPQIEPALRDVLG